VVKISKARQDELHTIAADHLNDREWFDYHDWDALIECEETLTDDELTWLREHASVVVTVEILP
jgi:hypothetical protein